MKTFPVMVAVLGLLCSCVLAQSARARTYSESRAVTERTVRTVPAAGSGGKADDTAEKTGKGERTEPEVIKVETDLVIVPFRVADKRGSAVTDIRQNEVRIFEDGEEREIAYFSDIDQPFTVALVLDMSYSSVFKLTEIQAAAKKFE